LPLDSVHTTVVILSHNEAEKQYGKNAIIYCKNATITMYADNMLAESMLADSMLADNMLADNMLAES